MDPVNRFRFTGGAQVPPLDIPPQGVAGMTRPQMQDAASEAAHRQWLAMQMEPPATQSAEASGNEYMRMQLGQAALPYTPEELAQQEAMAAQALTQDPSYLQQMIQLLGLK